MIRAKLAITPERWRLVKKIFDAAVMEPAEQRLCFVSRLCEGDAQLESEVHRLLLADNQAGSFLDVPAADVLGCLSPTDDYQLLSPGNVLAGRFEIHRFVDSGGMGQVYEAWDSELQEKVALKTIRPEIASNVTVIERFKQEVRQARGISHPNVCRVYDLFAHDLSPAKRLWFLTMQLLAGRTLADHLRDEGPFSTKEALGLIEQMVSGLAAAHELGVVHRDFKSGNIMLVPTSGGAKRAVITDFGLAMRITPTDLKPSGRGQGTPAYVAPEQWRDGTAGPAADQYALGVVICEMITGERPVPPQLDGPNPVPAKLPRSPRLEHRWEVVVRRCLEIRPEARFASVGDILPVLDPSRRRRILLRRVAVATVLLALSATVGLVIEKTEHRPRIEGLTRLTPATDLSSNPSFSRDGSMISYTSDRAESGNLDIWVQPLPQGTPIRITTDPAADDDSALSPDGRTVIFRSERNPAGIYISSVIGGGEKLLVKDGREPQFSPDGQAIVYSTEDDNDLIASGRIYLMDLRTASSVQLAPGFADAREPVWNSDGHHILFKGCLDYRESMPACANWWVTDRDGATPRNTGATTILNQREMKPLAKFGAWYDDTVLFSSTRGREVHLWQLSVSPKDPLATGEPTEVYPGDAREMVTSSAVAGLGILAFTDLSAAFHIWRIDHASDPSHAKAHMLTSDAELDIDPYVSPNGHWLAFTRGFAPDSGIWIRDVSSGRESLLPLPGSDKFSPLIDDAGTTVVYEEWTNGVPGIFMTKAGSTPSRLCTGCRNPTGWFGGGDGLLYGDPAMTEVDMYSFVTGRSQTVLHRPGANVAEATWSPVGSGYVLFTVSTNQVNGQVFVTRFPRDAKQPDNAWVAITSPSESSEKPRWSGDGRTIFYLSNRDNFWCIWAQNFDPVIGRSVGKPFVVQHYHDQKLSPYAINSHSFNLSTTGDSLYLNVAQLSGTIWMGKLDSRRHPLFWHRFGY